MQLNTTSDTPLTEILISLRDRAADLAAGWDESGSPTEQQTETLEADLDRLASIFTEDGEDPNTLVGVEFWLGRQLSRKSFEDDPEPAYFPAYQQLRRTLDDINKYVRDTLRWECHVVGMHARIAAKHPDSTATLTARARILGQHLQILRSLLDLAVVHADEADQARRNADAIGTPAITFQDVNERMNGRLNTVIDRRRDGNDAGPAAWKVIETLRGVCTADQIARWFQDRHWEFWDERIPAKEGFLETFVRYTDADGRFVYGSRVSERELPEEKDTPRAKFTVVEGQPGDDKLLISVNRAKYRATAGELIAGQTVHLPDPEGGFLNARLVTAVDIDHDTVIVTQDRNILGHGGEPIVTTLPADTAVIAWDCDLLRWTPKSDIERGRTRYGLLEDGRFADIIELAQQHAASGAAGRTAAVRGTFSCDRATVVRRLQDQGVTVVALRDQPDMLIAGAEADKAVAYAQEHDIQVRGEDDPVLNLT